MEEMRLLKRDIRQKMRNIISQLTEEQKQMQSNIVTNEALLIVPPC